MFQNPHAVKKTTLTMDSPATSRCRLSTRQWFKIANAASSSKLELTKSATFGRPWGVRGLDGKSVRIAREQLLHVCCLDFLHGGTEREGEVFEIPAHVAEFFDERFAV